MTFVIFEELNLKIDLLKCVKLALVHDLPEAITGDICAVAIAFGNKTSAEKFEGENAAIREIKQILPKRSGSEISDLWNEYEKGQTEEAKFVRALDKIEAVNHMICHQSLHNHPDFIATYANKLVTDFPALITVWHEVQKLLKPEFKKRGWNWKKEYELPIIEKKDEDNIAKIFDFLAITEHCFVF